MDTQIPNAVDRFIGNRLATLRRAAGLNHAELAGCVALQERHLQRYERASHRIGAATLWSLVNHLGQPIQSVFPETSAVAVQALATLAASEHPPPPPLETLLEALTPENRRLVERLAFSLLQGQSDPMSP